MNSVQSPLRVVVSGGARSGKSRFALQRALELGPRRAFVATAQAFDAEMQERIALHQRERAQLFTTFESATDLPQVLQQTHDFDVVLVDCLTLFLSNVLLAAEKHSFSVQQAQCEAAVQALCAALERHPAHVIVVSNEVGMGVVPPTPLGRVFRDVAGRANQQLAALAHELYLATLGVVLRLRPDPVQTLPLPR